MAIKGKGKTKSRPATRAPRPAPVVRKPPFFLRRWVQLLGAAIAGAGIVMIVVWATNGLRSNDVADETAAEAANARRVVQEWKTTVDGALQQVGSSQGGVGSITVLPTLTTSVETLATGDADKHAQETADTATGIVDTAVKTLQDVDLPTIISDQGLDLATTNYLLNSKARMVAGLQLYARVAAMVKAATAEGVDPAVADALIAEAKELLPIAKQVFDEGYTDYTSALGSVNLLQPAGGGLSGLSGLPPGTSPAGGVVPPGGST